MLSLMVSIATVLAMQLLWVWLIIDTQQWGLIPLTLIMLITYIQGIWTWRRIE